MLAVAKGQHLNFAILNVVSRGTTRFKAFTLRFDNVFLTSYQSSSGDTDGYPIDVVRIDYGKVTSTTIPQKADGSAGTPVTSSFNFVTNVGA